MNKSILKGLDDSWRELLMDELEKDYFNKLEVFVEYSYAESTCFPAVENIFTAFNSCSFKDIKVVILGQDPYHDVGQAHGLSFSVTEGVKHPPSLMNIFKELEKDIDFDIPKSGNLIHWAEQGILLLNATLTVEAHKAGAHQKKGWEKFTDAVIEEISKEKENVVFLLWGGYAKKKGAKIDKERHCVLESGHPSPLSANRGYWFGNRHFSKTNSYLLSKNKDEINW
ncbi:uracil-DNA glycosylase [Flavicella sp.]|uniref:uracil-DNA glycosylase n=1 Tax=Flavicella sp. TaxID=2957742 RepID=UPI00301B4ADE